MFALLRPFHTLRLPLSLPLMALGFFTVACGNTAGHAGSGGSGGSGGHGGQASGAAGNGGQSAEAAGNRSQAGASGSAESAGQAGVGGSAGSAGQAGASGAAGREQDAAACTADAGDALLIDDFEDGDTRSTVGGFWWVYTDSDNGGASEATIPTDDEGREIAAGPGYDSLHSFEIDYTFDRGTLSYDPYIGFGVTVKRDLSHYAGFSYMYQGDGHRIRLETTDVKDYDYYGFDVPASATWRTVDLPFSVLHQGGWTPGNAVPFDPAHVTSISFEVRPQSGGVNKMFLDDLRIVERAPRCPTPDLVVRAPAPPTETPIASIDITNPLQARAMRYLDRGFNLANWLENARFDNFDTYNEDFVARLAQAGFKSLRLPIDFDLYVKTGVSDGGASPSLTVDPVLFTVLDSFDQWTAAHGLGLTIDYHQYDHSLDFSQSASMDEVVELWRQVAEHFSTRPREDLFLELLNEPELSASGTSPTQDEWTALAKRIITAIRASDTTHTLIFGDVKWYDINPLSRRSPFDDTNIVYAIHFYEPELLTHQGASWERMASLHDIPYPYSEERFSQYSIDFGITPFSPSWQLEALQIYYQEGNATALRNRIVKAKTWAVTHNVPLICNEFGIYDLTSRLEDRSRYYADLSAIFRELEVPWQIWFVIMDPKTGVVDPEYVKALGLGSAEGGNADR